MNEPLRLRLYSSPLGLYLTAGGRLDATTADGLVRAVTLALRRLRPRRITIDLADVHTIDPAGAVALACCRDHAEHLDHPSCRAIGRILTTRTPDRPATRYAESHPALGVGEMSEDDWSVNEQDVTEVAAA